MNKQQRQTVSRQNKEKLIPKIISNILHNKEIPIYGKGENIRDWIFVDDHCRAILDLYHYGTVGEKYNIGGECELRNIDLVRRIINLMNGDEKLITFVDDRPGHDLRYAMDNSKIKNAVDFYPQYDIKTGLRKTILWYENN